MFYCISDGLKYYVDIKQDYIKIIYFVVKFENITYLGNSF